MIKNIIKFLCFFIPFSYSRKKMRSLLLDSLVNKEISLSKALNMFFRKNYIIFNKAPDEFTFSDTKEPLVSIIIPVYNQYNYTILCLWSILNHTKDISYEIIVADDNSTDETKNLQTKIKNIKVIHNSSNMGFLKNCNSAAQFATGKYLVFLNNDTQAQSGWLNSLVELIENDKEIGLVGSKLIFPNATLQEAGAYISYTGDSYRPGQGRNPALNRFNKIKEVDYISGASIMISRILWNDLKGFDEIYDKAYYEDVDIAFRIREEKGLKVVYQPMSEIIHFEGSSYNEKALIYSNFNKIKFVNKWSSILEQKHLPLEKLLEIYN